MDAADLELFERGVRQATERATGRALDDALRELGWVDALADDAPAAIAVVFRLQGRAGVTSSALDQVVAAGLGVPAAESVALVLPSLGGDRAPGTRHDGALHVDGVGTPALRGADRAVVALACGDGEPPAVATVPTAQLTLRAVDGIDPDFGLVQVRGTAVDFPVEPVDGSWDAAVALAELALSHELVGSSQTMLELAREHAMTRVQFGQPISRFQAVRHRLADTLLAIEAADAVARAAQETPSPLLAAAAKSVAGRGARTVARHCQQVLAGIGFTAEHPFHRSFRRILLLDQLFGSAHDLTRAQGDDLLRSRKLPALLPL
ncbi:MAG TPA: acyl-CoA dehydrogenase family protein [Acidimicrobiia bacterium]|nr:acyl-CoA dehydrogenase family protein [Acidimicrobiia bacterium]